jgi:hypothetical protein
MPNPAPPPGTSAVMILRNADNGDYEIYDIGNNSLLAAYFLGQAGLDWQPAGGLAEVDSQPVGIRLNGSAKTSLGHFSGNDTSDMMLRNANSGQFEVYDISNNNITSANVLGSIAANSQVAGFGDFNGDTMTDMMVGDPTSGTFTIYNISNNIVVGNATLGTVGQNWLVAGFGDFNADNSSDMMLRDVLSGARSSSTTSTTTPSPGHSTWGRSGRIGWWWASAILAATPAKPTCCCATSSQESSKSTTSATTPLRQHPAWERSASIGRSSGSARSAAPATATWCCATAEAAHSRSTTSPTIKSRRPPRWVRSARIGKLSALPPIRPQQRWTPRTLRILSSCKRWRGLAAEGARPKIRIHPPSAPMPHSSSFWRRRSTAERGPHLCRTRHAARCRAHIAAHHRIASCLRTAASARREDCPASCPGWDSLHRADG